MKKDGRMKPTHDSPPHLEITSAEKAFRALEDVGHSDAEEFWVLALGPKKTLLNKKMVFRGTVDSCLVHPRDVFRFACLENASSLLVAHNHPSGDLLPSLEDLRFTRQLVKAAGLMEIPIVDHLIVTRSGYSSLKSDGWCRFDGREKDS
jgi:DNA repair protein RadC